jgi:hypothetical protein
VDRQRPLSGETDAAFAAYLLYRGLDPGRRSIDAAYALWAQQRGVDRTGRRASSRFFVWSRDFEWVARVKEFDAANAATLAEATLDQRKALDAQRHAFELRNQKELESRVERIDRLLDKLEEAPPTDVTIQTTEAGVVRVQSVKGLDAAKYAALLKARLEAARHAVEGPRKTEQKSQTEPVANEQKPANTFTWIAPEPDPAPISTEQ